MSRRPYRRRIAASCALLLCTVAACSHGASNASRSTQGSTASRVPVVLLLGDSNLALSLTFVDVDFMVRKPQVAPVVNAIPGFGACDIGAADGHSRYDYWPTRIRALLQRMKPDAVVVQLGANDLRDPTCVAQYGSAIDRLVGAVPQDIPVAWCNVRLDYPYRPELARKINDALAAAPSRHHNLRILDFNTHFIHHPEWFASRGQNVHLNSAGQEEYADWLTQSALAMVAG